MGVVAAGVKGDSHWWVATEPIIAQMTGKSNPQKPVQKLAQATSETTHDPLEYKKSDERRGILVDEPGRNFPSLEIIISLC